MIAGPGAGLAGVVLFWLFIHSGNVFNDKGSKGGGAYLGHLLTYIVWGNNFNVKSTRRAQALTLAA